MVPYIQAVVDFAVRVQRPARASFSSRAMTTNSITDVSWRFAQALTDILSDGESSSSRKYLIDAIDWAAAKL